VIRQRWTPQHLRPRDARRGPISESVLTNAIVIPKRTLSRSPPTMNDVHSNDPEALTSDNLGSRARTAIRWKVLSQGLTTGLQMLTSIILARLLMPQDFGILGMATIVTGLAGLFRDLGLGQALIQRKEIEKHHLASAHWGTMVMGVLLLGLTVVVAPYVGIFYKEPRMVPVLQVLSLSFVISPFATIPNAMLQRNLDFRRPFHAALAGSVCYAVVGVTMTFMGYGYWRLAGGLLGMTLVSTLTICITTRQFPPLIPCFRGMISLFTFGVGNTGVQFFNYLARQSDYFVTGRCLDATALGIYTRAFSMITYPVTSVSLVIYPVLFPAFSQIQDDLVRTRNVFGRVLTLTSSVVFPSAAVLVVTAPELTPLVFGKQWQPSVLPSQILATAGILGAITNPCGAMAKARGTRFVYGEAWRQAVFAALLITGAYNGTRPGVVGVAGANAVAAVTEDPRPRLLAGRPGPRAVEGDVVVGREEVGIGE